MIYSTKIPVFLIIVILFVSCGNKQKQEVNLDLSSINLIEGINNPTENLLLGDLATDIEIIPLETSDRSIFNFEKITNIISTEFGIFISVGNNRILHFDRQGKYLGDIGQFGEGPQDFYYTRGLGYNKITKEVYVPSNFGTTNELKIYHCEDGRFLGKIKIAQNGVSLIANKNAGSAKEYCFIDGIHIIRRKLPLPNPQEEPWQIMTKNQDNQLISFIYDPISLKNIEATTNMSGTEVIKTGTYWGSEAPVFNCYKENRSVVFEGNDTVYHFSNGQISKMRYLMISGNTLADKDVHRLDKTVEYFNSCLIVKDFLETCNYIYLVVENEDYAYLLQFDKNTGHIGSIRNKGELKHSKLMNVHYRVVSVPEFTNNLCGGPTFYPFCHNEDEWIDFYSPDEIIENIEQIKEQKVLNNDKKEQLLRLAEKLKTDDNPILFVLKLK